MTAEQRRSRISARLHEAHQPISATALAKELGPSGIRVNAIAPGVIQTDMTSVLGADTLDQLREETPLQRLGRPEDVVQAMVYLTQADFVTGQVFGVSGGFVI